jgi:hypothetical protein
MAMTVLSNECYRGRVVVPAFNLKTDRMNLRDLDNVQNMQFQVPTGLHLLHGCRNYATFLSL